MLEVGQRGVARGGVTAGIGRRWMGMKELIGGAHTFVRGEREGATRRRKHIQPNTSKACAGQMGRAGWWRPAG
jgi:hypothetical protein